MFDRCFPDTALRTYNNEVNEWYVGKYSVCYYRYGRLVGAEWCVVDDFGNLVAV